MRNCGVTQRLCAGVLADNSNHLDQNIGIIWHKHSLLVNDNTVEHNVSQ